MNSLIQALKNASFLLIAFIIFSGCAPKPATGGGSGNSGGGADLTDYAATAADFECIKNWPKVRAFRITNKRDKLDEALALAKNPVKGQQYPVGTIIQLFPGEAMIKRKAGFDPDNNDWEYFELDVSRSGTSIRVRGTTDAVNRFGGQCLSCHADAKDFDFICEDNHGCVDLPPIVNDDFINNLQNTDPRC